MINREKACERVIKAMSAYYGFTVEPFEESINRQTGRTGTFHGRKVYNRTHNKLLLEVGGCDTEHIANHSTLNMIIVIMAEHISKHEPKIPKLDRKEWFRMSVIKGGKDQPS